MIAPQSQGLPRVGRSKRSDQAEADLGAPAKEADRCIQLFRCITARAAVPDPRHQKVTIELTPLQIEGGRVAGYGARPKAATCFDTLNIPRWETIDHIEAGMRDLLACKGFSDQ